MGFSVGRNRAALVRENFVVILAVILFSIPTCIFAQPTVDLIETSATTDGVSYTYRIVGASFSAIEKLNRFEKVNAETHTFSSFSFDESTHTCRIEVGAIGGDRDEGVIRYFLKEAVGALEESSLGDSREWADDDPRHGMVEEEELPTAIPEPTDPSTMPDWGHLLKKGNDQDEGGEK